MSLVLAMSIKTIDGLLGIASSLSKEHQFLSDTEVGTIRLQKALPKIKRVLIAIEMDHKIRERNKALDVWLWQLRDAVEAAEDVLHEMEYYEFEEKVQSQDDKGITISKYKRKFMKFMRHTFTDGLLESLSEAVNGLDKVVADMELFLQLAYGVSGDDYILQEPWKIDSTRETGSILTENKVFGRITEKNELLKWVTKLENEGDESTGTNLSAFTIAGIGGIGKTTLAQLICDDTTVKKHFELIMWVCVSNNFDLETITRRMLEAAKVQCDSSESLENLQKDLSEKLENKRFFLVLDDVWNDDNISGWEKLIAPLEQLRKNGSKILVTSRMDSVAEIVAKVTKGNKESLELKGLEKGEYLLLFNKHAFAGAEPEKYKHLQLIGEEIAKKLGGCPLVAKLIGGQLNSYLDEYYWEKILNEDILNIGNNTNDILKIIRLSYNHLSANLRYCFRYCSLFPQDYEFKKDELILRWMGSGLIPYNDQKPENIADEYFNLLVRKSFFDFKHESVYVMHDLLHELAKAVSSNECLRIQYHTVVNIPNTLRHLYVHEIKNCELLGEISRLKQLRTLIVVFKGNDAKENQVPIFQEILRRTKSLRLLCITTNFPYRLPHAIGDLIHLCYISLDRSVPSVQLNWFPESIYKLYHLRVIKFPDDLVVNSKAMKMNGMSNLINLRHLLIPGDLMVKIPRVGKLTSLQSPLVFKIQYRNGYMIEELKNLNEICELSLWNVERIKNTREAKLVSLATKRNLKGLLLDWSEDVSRDSNADERLIDKLEPSPTISELSIIGYNGIKHPIWMSNCANFTTLVSISLFGCPNWELLPPLGHLPLLENLDLVDMLSIRRIDSSFYGDCNGRPFLSLKELKFKAMRQLEEWFGLTSNNLSFPRLEKLTIEHCPNLKFIPLLPFTLTELSVKNTGIFKFPDFSPDKSATDQIIVRAPELRRLSVRFCKNLENISLEVLRKLKSVESMDIGKCPRLITHGTSDSEGLLPSTMVNLCIGSCGNLEEFLLGSLLHLSSLMILSLEGCTNLTTLPSRESFSSLKSLNAFSIKDCKELISLGGIDAVKSLQELRISGCDKLTIISLPEPFSNVNYSKITNLILDHDLLLLVDPLRSLSSVETLKIGHVSSVLPEQWLLQNSSTLERVEIYDASSLKYLPTSLSCLTSLWRLQICKANNTKTLDCLPNSLEELHICGSHHKLMEQYGHPRSTSKNLLNIRFEEDFEIIKEECGDKLTHPCNFESASEDEESENDEEVETSEEERNGTLHQKKERNGTSRKIIDDSSLVLAPSFESSGVSIYSLQPRHE